MGWFRELRILFLFPLELALGPGGKTAAEDVGGAGEGGVGEHPVGECLLIVLGEHGVEMAQAVDAAGVVAVVEFLDVMQQRGHAVGDLILRCHAEAERHDGGGLAAVVLVCGSLDGLEPGLRERRG